MTALRYAALASCLLAFAGCDSSSTPFDSDDPLSDSRETPFYPDRLQIGASDVTSITLTWRDRSEFETGYAIERVPWDGDAQNAAEPIPTEGFETVGTVGADAEAFTDTDLAESARWVYRIRPTGGESKASAVIVAQPKVLARFGPDFSETELLSPSGDALAVSLPSASEIRLYDPETGRLERTSSRRARLLVGGDGCYAGTSFEDVDVFDSTLGLISQIEVEARGVDELTISEDCSTFALIELGVQDTTRVYDAQTGAERAVMAGLGYRMALSPDGEIVYGLVIDEGESPAASVEARRVSDGSVLWSQSTEIVSQLFVAEGSVHAVTLEPSEHVELDLQTGAEVRTWPAGFYFRAAPVGEFIHETNSGVLRIYRRSDYSLVRTLIPYGFGGERLPFSFPALAMGSNGLRIALDPDDAPDGAGLLTYDLADGWEIMPVIVAN